MIRAKPRRLPALVTPLLFLGLAAILGCGENVSSPGPQASVRTTVSLARTIISPGDTVVATVRAVNEGSASASFLFYCDRYLYTSLESGEGVCYYDCIVAACLNESFTFELQPGGVLEQTVRYACVDWAGNPLPPGLYVVTGGIAARGATHVRAGFLIRAS